MTDSEQSEPRLANPESVLVSVGALEEASDGDLVLTDSFWTAWREEIEAVKDSDAKREEIAEMLETDEREVEFQAYQEAFKILVDGQVVGILESQAAFYADLAGARLLGERYDEWDALSIAERSRLLKGLRLFLEQCPECGYEVTFETKEVQSCCGGYPVAAVDCNRCASRLFESGPLET
jgi:hypothetical protein